MHTHTNTQNKHSPQQSTTLGKKATVTRDHSPLVFLVGMRSAQVVVFRFLTNPLGDKSKAKALKLLSQSVSEDNSEC